MTLTGTRASIDFNPLTDRLHVLTDSGQHVSIDPQTGAATAEPLTGAAGVTSLAFTDNRADTSSTTLVALNTTTDAFGRIDNPATTGTFVAIGALGVDPGAASTLDVSAVDRTIIAAIRGPSSVQATLALIDPTTGAVTSIGIPDTITVEDIAIASPGRVRFARSTFFHTESTIRNEEPLVIERIGDVTEPITVTVDLGAGGTATDGLDYSSSYPERVTFTSGERTKVVRFFVSGDTIDEPDETINFVLLAPSSAATLTIVDDDGALPPPPGKGLAVHIMEPTAPVMTQTEARLIPATTSYLAVSGVVENVDLLGLHPATQVRWVNDRGFDGTATLDSGKVRFTIPSVPLLPGVNIIRSPPRTSRAVRTSAASP